MVPHARRAGASSVRRRVRRLRPGLLRLPGPPALPGRDQRGLRAHHRPGGAPGHHDPRRLGDRRRAGGRAGRPHRPGADAADHDHHLRRLHRGVRLRDQLRDAAGVPRPAGSRLRRRVGGGRGPRRRVLPPRAPGPGARVGAERVGRGLGALRDRLHGRVQPRRPGARLAGAVLDRRTPRAARALRAVGGQGRARGRGAAQGEHRPRLVPRDLPRPAAAHDAVRVAAGHRRAGRLLRAVHLAADLPQDRPRPLRDRHRRLPVLPHHRRVRGLHLRRLRHRQARPQEDVRAVRGAVGGADRRATPSSPQAPTPPSCSSASRWASARRRSSPASAPTSPSCTRRTCAAPGRASPTTSAAASARCSRRASGSRRSRWASAGR